MGQSKSSERFEVRKKEHNRKFGVEHKYDILEDKVKGKEYLDYLEEKYIQEEGGLRKEGGTLVNKRHQITGEHYKELEKKYDRSIEQKLEERIDDKINKRVEEAVE